MLAQLMEQRSEREESVLLSYTVQNLALSSGSANTLVRQEEIASEWNANTNETKIAQFMAKATYTRCQSSSIKQDFEAKIGGEKCYSRSAGSQTSCDVHIWDGAAAD